MGKIVKGLLYLLGLLIGLTIIIAIAIPLFIDPNDYRNQISNIVEEKTGRTLEIKGEIELSLFPWIGIELGEISLSNAAGFGKKPFTRVEKVDVKIKLLPLLRKAVEMDTIILHGMSLNLAKNSEGTDNWSDLAQSPTQTPVPKAPKVSTTAPLQPPASVQEASPTQMLTAFAIGGLEINDANIQWDDQSLQQKVEINHFNLVSGAIALDSEFPLEVDFNTIINMGSDTPQMKGDIALKTMIGLNIDQQQYHLRQLQLTSVLKSAQLPNGQLNSKIAGNFSADLIQQMARVEGLTINVLGTILTLNSDVSQINKTPVVNGNIQLKVTQAKPLIALLGDALPKTITHKMIETTSIKTHFNLNTESQKAALKKFQLNFDQSIIKGNASVTNFTQPAIRYDFDINQVNIDRYFPPSKNRPTQTIQAAKPTASVTNTPTTEEPLPIPVDLLRTLDIDGSLRLGALQVMNLHTQKIVSTVKAKKGKIMLSPLSAELYQGKFNGGITIDVRNKVPTIKVKEKLTGVEAGPLLKDLLGKDYVTGKALLKADITTTGDRISQFKKRLNGTAQLRFEDGAVNGIDITQLLREANAAYKKQPVEKSTKSPKTDFALLSASVNIVNGLIANNDLNAKSPMLRINGGGFANIITEQIDYKMKAAVVNTLEGQGGKTLSELKGLTIPITIRGTFTEPKVKVNLAQLLKANAKAVARKKAQAKFNAEKKRLKKNLQKKLLNQFKLKF